MARGDYKPEIRSALGTGKPGRVNVSPPRDSLKDKESRPTTAKTSDATLHRRDAVPQALPEAMQRPERDVRSLPPPSHSGGGTDVHHVAAATSIAHAILGHSRGGM